MGKQRTPFPEPNADGDYTNINGINIQDDQSITISNIRAKCHSAKRDPNFLYSEFQVQMKQSFLSLWFIS
jgi:hypothetical protein